MTMGTDSKEQNTLEAQSRVVREISTDIANRFDHFLNISTPTESKIKDMPTPKLDAISEIALNLQQTENNLNQISGQFNKLKSRIIGLREESQAGITISNNRFVGGQK